MKKLIKLLCFASICLAFSSIFSACGGNDNVAVQGVSLNKSTLTLTEGTTETLTATVTPKDATEPGVTWTSSDQTIATVSNGLVTAVKPGVATITVTTTDGSKMASCALTVKEFVEEDSNDDATFTGSGISQNGMELEGGSGVMSWATFDLLSGASQRYYGKVGTYNKILVTVYNMGATYDTATDTYKGGLSITFALWVSKGNKIVRVGTYSQLDADAESMTKWHFDVNGTTNSFYTSSEFNNGLTTGTVRITLTGTTYTIDFAGTASSGSIKVKAHYSGAMTYMDKSTK